MLRGLPLVRSVGWGAGSQRVLVPISRTWCESPTAEALVQDEIEREAAQRGPPITPGQGLNVLHRRIRGAREKSQQLDSLLLPLDERRYLPLKDPKYDPEKLTEKSSTYLDIIRLTSKPTIEIPVDVNVRDVKGFNYSLLQLFGVGQVKEARDYFFAVTARKDSPAQRSSYHIAMAEFVDAGEVFLAEILLNFLKATPEGPDVASFNIMISGCVTYSSLRGALDYCAQMQERGISPNHQTTQYLLALHLKLGEIEPALSAANDLKKHGALPEYAHGLFARAYAAKGNFDAMNEHAWGEHSSSLSSAHCNSIVESLVTQSDHHQIDQFLQRMDQHKIPLGWSVAQQVLRLFKDQRNQLSLNPVLEALVARVTAEPNDKERLDMIRTAIIQDREEEVVFRKRKRKAPIWKRKVEYKNPADATWDTLIQEYLAVAHREQRIRAATAKDLRRKMDVARKSIDPNKKPNRAIKRRAQWKM